MVVDLTGSFRAFLDLGGDDVERVGDGGVSGMGTIGPDGDRVMLSSFVIDVEIGWSDDEVDSVRSYITM